MTTDNTDNTDNVDMPAVDEGQAAPQPAPATPEPKVGQPAHQPVLQHAPSDPVPQVTGTPTQAEDVDLIEKAWVEKAKDIVDKTQGDPFTQSKQLNQMKADYIKKRYNRDVKTDE